MLESLHGHRQNGSFQELALAQAESLLTGIEGPKRILLLTDGHLRPSLTEQRLQVAAETGVVAVVVPPTGASGKTPLKSLSGLV